MRQPLRQIIVASVVCCVLAWAIWPAEGDETASKSAVKDGATASSSTQPADIKALQEQLEQTRAQLEAMQKQFDAAMQEARRGGGKAGQEATSKSPGTGHEFGEGPPGLQGSPELQEKETAPSYPGYVLEALEVAREALQNISEESSKGSDSELQDALKTQRTAAQNLEGLAVKLGDMHAKVAAETERKLEEINREIEGQFDREDARRELRRAQRELRRAQGEAEREARQAIREARQSLREAEHEVRDALRDIRGTTRKTNVESVGVSFGSSRVVKQGESIEELTVLRGDGEVFGDVEGDAVVMAGDLIIHPGGRVGGDAVVMGGEIIVEDGGEIEGERVNLPTGDIKLPLDQFPIPGRSLVGDVSDASCCDDEDEGIGGWIRSTIIWYLLLMASGLITMTFVPKRLESIERTIEDRGGASGVVGVVLLIALVPATLVLVVSVIGIPLIPLLYAGVVLFTLVGVTAVAKIVGRRVPFRSRKPRTPGGAFLWGLAITLLACRLPYVGIPIAVVGILVALGAVVLSRFGDTSELS